MSTAPGLPRWLEATLAAIGLILVSPLLALLALLVRLSSPGPVLYRQVRVGQGGQPFTLFKLRSMRLASPGGGGPEVTAEGDDRITPVGRFLRRSKLDELPELWNVLTGELSFVGPRPEVPRYVDLGDPRWQRVLAVRPGLTDEVTLRLRNEEQLLASIEGDAEAWYRTCLLPWKLDAYAHAIARRSLVGDLVVILRTVFAIVLPGRAVAPTREQIEATARRR